VESKNVSLIIEITFRFELGLVPIQFSVVLHNFFFLGSGHQVLNTKTELQRALEGRRIQQNMKMKVSGEDSPLPEFMQVHKRITSGNQSS